MSRESLSEASVSHTVNRVYTTTDYEWGTCLPDVKSMLHPDKGIEGRQTGKNESYQQYWWEIYLDKTEYNKREMNKSRDKEARMRKPKEREITWKKYSGRAKGKIKSGSGVGVYTYETQNQRKRVGGENGEYIKTGLTPTLSVRSPSRPGLAVLLSGCRWPTWTTRRAKETRSRHECSCTNAHAHFTKRVVGGATRASSPSLGY